MDGTALPSNLSAVSIIAEIEGYDKTTFSAEKTQKYKEEHIYVCSECSATFTSVETCKQHMRKDHTLLSLENTNNSEKSLQKGEEQNKAEVEASETADLNSAEGKHESDVKKISERKQFERTKKFRCPVDSCGYGFTSEKNRKYHLTCHTKEKRFVCPECGDSFTLWRMVVFHLWKNHEIDIDLVKCNACNYRTFSLFKLKNHKLIHGDERPFLCVTCGKSFKQINQLRNHNLTHKDKKDIPGNRWYSEQECTICFRKFSDVKCLRKHIVEVHKKIKPFDCKVCDYTTARKEMLQLHMRNHTGEKPYKCEFCSYCTADHNSLRRHRMRHTGEKRYTCSYCKYSSIQAISLKSHMISKHPGKEGAYSCALCQFTSINKDIFECHVSDHSQGLIPGTSVNNPKSDIPILPYQPIDVSTPKLDMEQSSTNMKTAETVSKCLYALTQTDGVAQLPPDVTVIASQVESGIQTVTIEIPGENGSLPQQFLLKIQPSSNEALHVMYQPVAEINNSETDLSAVKFDEEFIPNLKLSDIAPNDTSPMGIIVSPDQIFLQDFKHIEEGVPINTFVQIPNIASCEESISKQ